VLLDDIRAAVGLLTVVPVGDGQVGEKPTAWFSWVGWLYAAVALTIASFAAVWVRTSLASLLVGGIVVSAWAMMSRLLHWDGLSDTFDGLWGGHTPEARLKIMADPRAGAFGVVAVTLTCLMQVVSVAAVFASRDWWALAAAPVAGRFAASLAAWLLPAARPGGLGASVVRRPGPVEVAIASLGVGVLLIVPSPARIMQLALALVVAYLVPRVLARRVGGVTGDILGASVLVVETVVLAVAALIGG